ncbi:MAG: hypothetical protein KGJ38_08310 [Burkholderiaceae bacterium]|nr:hypothetical protein [Burkholderiaceae bacterium]
MRKADYALLARILRQLDDRATAARIARAFAAGASVDRAAFLRACGIIPD